MHLTTEELIDLAERTREESSDPHLQSCEVCRHQLAVLRTAMSAAAEVEVPEPSPLFWKHLSERVHEAVAAEGVAAIAVPGLGLGEGAAVVAGMGGGRSGGCRDDRRFTSQLPGHRSRRRSDRTWRSFRRTSRRFHVPLVGAADDPSLALVADLTSQMDPDAFDETGWTSHAGAVDEAVVNLTDDERLELQRLLKEELAKS